jgi:hypothetical protein
MKRVFSHPLTALVIGLLLRLFFVFRLPSAAGDTPLYEALASNWLKSAVYGISLNGTLAPLDIRMPGYPAYLAVIQALTHRSAEASRLWAMLGQVFVDLAACVVIAGIAARCAGRNMKASRIFLAALWLAALCPFTANYTAVPLTETFAVLTTALALLYFIPLVYPEFGTGNFPKWAKFPRRTEFLKDAALAGVYTGLGTLFRPEIPLVLLSCLPVVLWVAFRRNQPAKGLRAAGVSVALCFLVLLPWTLRNAVTLHEFQPLTPKYTTLPGELPPVGFIAWERTWLYRFREVFLVSWKLNDETIQIDDLPARAFDSPEERQHVAAILEQYNHDLNLTAEEDQQFARIASERTARRPLRTYLWVPLQRMTTLWLTPRIEQLPVSGSVFPLAETWETDREDLAVTVGLFFVNIFYLALALWGATRLWRHSPEARAAVILLAAFVLARTVFLTTVETPEPRYVLVCFPAAIALAAHAFARPNPV